MRKHKHRRDYRALTAFVVCGLAIAILFAMLVASINDVLPRAVLPLLVLAIGVLGILITLEPFGQFMRKLRLLRRESTASRTS